MKTRKFAHVDDPTNIIEILDTEFANVQAEAILSFENEDGDKIYKEVKEKKTKLDK